MRLYLQVENTEALLLVVDSISSRAELTSISVVWQKEDDTEISFSESLYATFDVLLSVSRIIQLSLEFSSGTGPRHLEMLCATGRYGLKHWMVTHTINTFPQ